MGKEFASAGEETGPDKAEPGLDAMPIPSDSMGAGNRLRSLHSAASECTSHGEWAGALLVLAAAYSYEAGALKGRNSAHAHLLAQAGALNTAAARLRRDVPPDPQQPNAEALEQLQTAVLPTEDGVTGSPTDRLAALHKAAEACRSPAETLGAIRVLIRAYDTASDQLNGSRPWLPGTRSVDASTIDNHADWFRSLIDQSDHGGHWTLAEFQHLNRGALAALSSDPGHES